MKIIHQRLTEVQIYCVIPHASPLPGMVLFLVSIVKATMLFPGIAENLVIMPESELKRLAESTIGKGMLDYLKGKI